MELTLDFNSDDCDSYGPFFQCLIHQTEGRLTSRPNVRHCLTKLRGDRSSLLSSIVNFILGGGKGGGLFGVGEHSTGRGGLFDCRNRGAVKDCSRVFCTEGVAQKCKVIIIPYLMWMKMETNMTK